MADAETARLCVQTIRSHFGSLTAVSVLSAYTTNYLDRLTLSSDQTVASTLLTRGRLPLSQLVRFTGLKSRTVRQAVLVLVQHNILWHALSEDDGEVLEVNTGECLTRLRFGRYVWQAEQLYGPVVSFILPFQNIWDSRDLKGGEIVQMILDHGKLRPPDLVLRLSIQDPKGSFFILSRTH